MISKGITDLQKNATIILSQGLEDYTKSKVQGQKLTDLVVTRNDFPTARYSIDLNLEKLMYSCAMIIVRKKEHKNKTSITHDDFIYVSSENFGELTSSMATVNKCLLQQINVKFSEMLKLL